MDDPFIGIQATASQVIYYMTIGPLVVSCTSQDSSHHRLNAQSTLLSTFYLKMSQRYRGHPHPTGLPPTRGDRSITPLIHTQHSPQSIYGSSKPANGHSRRSRKTTDTTCHRRELVKYRAPKEDSEVSGDSRMYLSPLMSCLTD